MHFLVLFVVLELEWRVCLHSEGLKKNKKIQHVAVRVICHSFELWENISELLFKSFCFSNNLISVIYIYFSGGREG